MIYTSPFPERPVPEKTLYDIMFNTERKFIPKDDHPLYIDVKTGATTYYGEIQTMTLTIAAGLQKLGLKQGDVVATCSYNHVIKLIFFFFKKKKGGVFAAIDRATTVSSLIDDLDLVKAKFIVGHERTLEKVLEAAKAVKIPKENILVFGDNQIGDVQPLRRTLMCHGQLDEPSPCTKDELKTRPIFLYYTSGTTGRKKAVTLTNASLASSLLQRDEWDLSKARNLTYTELHHGSSLVVGILMAIYNGVSTYIMSDFDFEEYCHLIEKHQITHSAIQPWIASRLGKDPIVDKYDLSSIQGLISAGSTLDLSIVEAVEKRIGKILLNVYATTEVLGILVITPALVKNGYTGVLAGGFSARIIDGNGNDVKIGEVGEFLVKGPSRTPGYYNNPKATAAAIDEEGFYHTGDLVTITEEGYISFYDREKDLIKYELYHIQPGEIESVLVSSPKVNDCAVIGVYKEELCTEVPRAFVMLSNGFEKTDDVARELEQLVADNLPDYKHLRGGVTIMDSLPRTTTGKVIKPELRALAKREEEAIVTA
ncbi:acetyl-CoA synthetase-like protein [Backusella circina FSU 941]|nr:acetyl-CoA synthetase-like protein [Backusella circina FSU 941]